MSNVDKEEIIQNQIGGCATKLCMDDLYVLSSFSKKKLQCPFPETFLEEIIFIRMIFEGTQKIHMFINVIFVHVSSILYCHKSLQNAFPQLIFEGKAPKGRERGFKIIEEEKRWSNNKPLRGLACAFAGVRGWLAGII